MQTPSSFKILSWNLLHENGASLKEISYLLEYSQADIFLMQEARSFTSDILTAKNGAFHRLPLKYYRHGTACWSRFPFITEPYRHPLPSGSLVQRHAQILHFNLHDTIFSLANVHLSHRQWLNRKQLQTTCTMLGEHAAIIGDFNMVGPSPLRDFQDIGPYHPTHKMLNFLPLRLDRCLIKGLIKEEANILPRFRSDHHPILLTLRLQS